MSEEPKDPQKNWYQSYGNNEQYKQELIRTVIQTRQELRYKQERRNYNIYAGVCQKVILAQRKIIFKLQMQIQQIEYKLKNNLK